VSGVTTRSGKASISVEVRIEKIGILEKKTLIYVAPPLRNNFNEGEIQQRTMHEIEKETTLVINTLRAKTATP
jgi:hypothetical protein